MSEDIGERMAAVETRVAAIEQNMSTIGADVRFIRDFILKDNASRLTVKRFFAAILTFIGGAAAAWEAWGKH